jgi:hypothetical protein
MNPDVYIFDLESQDRGKLIVRHPLPYSDLNDLSPGELARLIERDYVVDLSWTP